MLTLGYVGLSDIAIKGCFKSLTLRSMFGQTNLSPVFLSCSNLNNSVLNLTTSKRQIN